MIIDGLHSLTGASLKIIQLLQHFEHLVNPLAGVVHICVAEYGHKSIVAELMRYAVETWMKHETWMAMFETLSLGTSSFCNCWASITRQRKLKIGVLPTLPTDLQWK